MRRAEKDLCLQCVSSAITTSRGLLFFKNMSADLTSSKKIASDVRVFFRELAKCIKSPASSKSSVELLSEVSNQERLHLRGARTRARLGTLTTTVTFDTLEKYYLDLSKAPIPMAMTSGEKASFLGEASIPKLLKPSERFRGGKKMVWLAPYTDILSEFTAGFPSADELRSFLGLSHFNQDEVLVNLQFSGGIMKTYQVRRPTSFDGGPNLIFRTDKSSRKHGYAVNLVGLSDGAREVVSEPIAAAEVASCKVVGQVRTMPPIDWSDVASSCVGDINVILKFLR